MEGEYIRSSKEFKSGGVSPSQVAGSTSSPALSELSMDMCVDMCVDMRTQAYEQACVRPRTVGKLLSGRF